MPLSSPDRWCEGPGCQASIAFLRPQAKYCSAKCRMAARDERNRSALSSRTVSFAGQPGYFQAAESDRGYLDNWRPQGKTRIMLGRAKSVLGQFKAHLPLTCRQIYYRMVAEFGYSKGSQFESALYGLLNTARRAGEVPFDAIRDDGIMGGGGWWNSPAEMIEHWGLEARGYWRDVQEGQPVRVQVWCEAAGMVPQLSRVADDYSVPVYSCGGFNSLTSIRQIVQSCVYDTPGRTILLHLGDCDPSGYSIFQAVVEDVAEFLERDRLHNTQTFGYERVAIDLSQISQYNLSTDPITTKDSRSREWARQGLTRKCELEAMAPDDIAKLLKAAIERYVDSEHIERVRVEEAAEKEALEDAADLSKAAIGAVLAGERLGAVLAKPFDGKQANGSGGAA